MKISYVKLDQPSRWRSLRIESEVHDRMKLARSDVERAQDVLKPKFPG